MTALAAVPDMDDPREFVKSVLLVDDRAFTSPHESWAGDDEAPDTSANDDELMWLLISSHCAFLWPSLASPRHLPGRSCASTHPQPLPGLAVTVWPPRVRPL